jgi:hypothetical protein
MGRPRSDPTKCNMEAPPLFVRSAPNSGQLMPRCDARRKGAKSGEGLTAAGLSKISAMIICAAVPACNSVPSLHEARRSPWISGILVKSVRN